MIEIDSNKKNLQMKKNKIKNMKQLYLFMIASLLFITQAMANNFRNTKLFIS
jgi:hypothetical protein